MIAIGDLVSWRGRRCHVRGVGPASLSERPVQLEEVGTGRMHSAPLAELESIPAGRLRASLVPGTPEYPQQRVSNLGRTIVVHRAADDRDRFVFTHVGDPVAELHPPSGRGRGDLLGWRLTFPVQPERILAAPAGEPPISGALFFIDIALHAEDRERVGAGE